MTLKIKYYSDNTNKNIILNHGNFENKIFFLGDLRPVLRKQLKQASFSLCVTVHEFSQNGSIFSAGDRVWMCGDTMPHTLHI